MTVICEHQIEDEQEVSQFIESWMGIDFLFDKNYSIKDDVITFEGNLDVGSDEDDVSLLLANKCFYNPYFY